MIHKGFFFFLSIEYCYFLGKKEECIFITTSICRNSGKFQRKRTTVIMVGDGNQTDGVMCERYTSISTIWVCNVYLLIFSHVCICSL